MISNKRLSLIRAAKSDLRTRIITLTFIVSGECDVIVSTVSDLNRADKSDAHSFDCLFFFYAIQYIDVLLISLQNTFPVIKASSFVLKYVIVLFLCSSNLNKNKDYNPNFDLTSRSRTEHSCSEMPWTITSCYSFLF